MIHRSLRLCAILGAIGIACTAYALALAGAAVWDTAHRGDLITMPCSAAR